MGILHLPCRLLLHVRKGNEYFFRCLWLRILHF